MTDVFISYATTDRVRAREIANALSARGWSVWWDRKIRAGQTFDEVIERELETAKNIVVLWSEASIGSEWVKNEAAVAAQRGVLIPVLLDKVKIPLEFRRKQTADLIGWNGDPTHSGLQALFEALEGGSQGSTAPAPATRPKWPVPHSYAWMTAGVIGFVLGSVLTYLLVGLPGPEWTGRIRDPVAGASSTSSAVKGRAESSAPKLQSARAALPTNLPTSDNGVFLDVVSFVKAGELTTLEWVLRNTSDKKLLVCGKASQAQLIDQVIGESWRALHSGGPAASCDWISERGQSGGWAKFKLPSLENRRFSLSLPTLQSSPELPQPQVSSK